MRQAGPAAVRRVGESVGIADRDGGSRAAHVLVEGHGQRDRGGRIAVRDQGIAERRRTHRRPARIDRGPRADFCHGVHGVAGHVLGARNVDGHVRQHHVTAPVRRVLDREMSPIDPGPAGRRQRGGGVRGNRRVDGLIHGLAERHGECHRVAVVRDADEVVVESHGSGRQCPVDDQFVVGGVATRVAGRVGRGRGHLVGVFGECVPRGYRQRPGRAVDDQVVADRVGHAVEYDFERAVTDRTGHYGGGVVGGLTDDRHGRCGVVDGVGFVRARFLLDQGVPRQVLDVGSETEVEGPVARDAGDGYVDRRAGGGRHAADRPVGRRSLGQHEIGRVDVLHTLAERGFEHQRVGVGDRVGRRLAAERRHRRVLGVHTELRQRVVLLLRSSPEVLRVRHVDGDVGGRDPLVRHVVRRRVGVVAVPCGCGPRAREARQRPAPNNVLSEGEGRGYPRVHGLVENDSDREGVGTHLGIAECRGARGHTDHARALLLHVGHGHANGLGVRSPVIIVHLDRHLVDVIQTHVLGVFKVRCDGEGQHAGARIDAELGLVRPADEGESEGCIIIVLHCHGGHGRLVLGHVDPGRGTAAVAGDVRHVVERGEVPVRLAGDRLGADSGRADDASVYKHVIVRTVLQGEVRGRQRRVGTEGLVLRQHGLRQDIASRLVDLDRFTPGGQRDGPVKHDDQVCRLRHTGRVVGGGLGVYLRSAGLAPSGGGRRGEGVAFPVLDVAPSCKVLDCEHVVP